MSFSYCCLFLCNLVAIYFQFRTVSYIINMYNRFFYVEILGIYRNFTNFAMNIKNEEVLYHIVHVALSVFRKYLRKG